MNSLAIVLWRQGNYIEAEKLGRETLEIQRRVLGPEHPSTVILMNNIANFLEAEGRFAEAEKLQRETLAIKRRVLGPEHSETAISIYNIGCTALLQGRRDEALSLLREAVDHGLAPNLALEIEKDPDLKSLHGDPRFEALIAHAKEHAAAAQKPK